METIAVFVNDAAHARHLLQPMLAAADDTHWVLVACPPALTRHVGRWVSKAGAKVEANTGVTPKPIPAAATLLIFIKCRLVNFMVLIW